MGLYYQKQLDNKNNTRTIYRCADCHSHIFTSAHVQSDNFNGKHGPGFLVSRVVNVKPGKFEAREMLTGMYEVCDIHCQQCDLYLGWKYLHADRYEEKYKEHSYVMELRDLDHDDKDKKMTRHSNVLNVWY